MGITLEISGRKAFLKIILMAFAAHSTLLPRPYAPLTRQKVDVSRPRMRVGNQKKFALFTVNHF